MEYSSMPPGERPPYLERLKKAATMVAKAMHGRIEDWRNPPSLKFKGELNKDSRFKKKD